MTDQWFLPACCVSGAVLVWMPWSDTTYRGWTDDTAKLPSSTAFPLSIYSWAPSEPLSIPLQLLCCLVKRSPFLWHTSGWNTCDQTAAGELNTCIFDKSLPASHHHPNKCYCYLQITNSWLHFFSSYLSLPGRGSKGGKTKTRAMWLIKGTNLGLQGITLIYSSESQKQCYHILPFNWA